MLFPSGLTGAENHQHRISVHRCAGNRRRGQMVEDCLTAQSSEAGNLHNNLAATEPDDRSRVNERPNGPASVLRESHGECHSGRHLQRLAVGQLFG